MLAKDLKIYINHKEVTVDAYLSNPVSDCLFIGQGNIRIVNTETYHHSVLYVESLEGKIYQIGKYDTAKEISVIDIWYEDNEVELVSVKFTDSAYLYFTSEFNCTINDLCESRMTWGN